MTLGECLRLRYANREPELYARDLACECACHRNGMFRDDEFEQEWS